jgi:hypothetical protein
MSQPFMTFDKGLAEKSGSGGGIQEGGAHICTIESAVYVSAGTGSHGVEFTVKTDDGLSGRYLTAYFAKADNTPIGSGQSLLNALMGFCGAKSLSWVEANINNEMVSHCPELKGKTVGLFLQKRLYTKATMEDAYGFDIRCPFDPVTKQTFKEKSQGKFAIAIDSMSASYKDKDDRKTSSGSMAQASIGGGNQLRSQAPNYGGFDGDNF